MSDVSVLIVEDEPLARRRLARMVAGMKGVTLVGEAGDANAAYQMVGALNPDILLLDIQMPGASGFDLVERLGASAPAVVFVTAFDHHALRAFNARAADYVTKPVSAGRLAAAIDRAIALSRADRGDERVAELTETVAALRSALREQERPSIDFWVKTKNDHLRIPANSIAWIRAEGDYVRIHANGDSHLFHESLASLDRRLDAREFTRIHRSTIIRLNRVSRVRTAAFGALIVVLDDDSEMRVGRTYMSKVRKML